ncbi:hypothetical protein SISSUDRAFT_1066042 [Sistotremastrum suecicum HHB10207 ss-3]|uniref:Uncharacterized protein n=1 Tax=Sistotremastrum suecicum HHB10207 ss-3 TaxID=1314776 RepID=A0A165YSH3_9AGAM|nr:hypothetical protein SISSUDRAFT_1066042 [Sistotremastrum suecicum HHB10207 ss-3]
MSSINGENITCGNAALEDALALTLDNNPTLPDDAQRLIVEFAASRGKKECLKLCSVSKNFAAWVYPVLFFCIKVSGYTKMCDLATEIHPRKLTYVRHLFLCPPHELDHGLLNMCVRLTHLMVHTFGTPSFGNRPPRIDTSFWNGTTFPSHVTILGADCSIFVRYNLRAPSALLKCTHLSLESIYFHLDGLMELISQLPALSHLALFTRYPSELDVSSFALLCQESSNLEMILLGLLENRWAHSDRIIYSEQAPELCERFLIDQRVFVADVGSPIRIWEYMAMGRMSIWEQDAVSRVQVAASNLRYILARAQRQVVSDSPPDPTLSVQHHMHAFGSMNSVTPHTFDDVAQIHDDAGNFAGEISWGPRSTGVIANADMPEAESSDGLSHAPESDVNPEQNESNHLFTLWSQWRRDARKANRYAHRLWTARSNEIAHRHVPLLLSLGEDGMSSDSSHRDGRLSIYRMHAPRIPRSREISDILYWLDEVSMHTRNGDSYCPRNQMPPPERRAYGR